MRVSQLLCSSHFFEAILVFSKNLNSFSLPIFVLNRYSIDFWSLSNPSNPSTLSARYSEHSSTKCVGFWSYSSQRKITTKIKVPRGAKNTKNIFFKKNLKKGEYLFRFHNFTFLRRSRRRRVIIILRSIITIFVTLRTITILILLS